MPVKEGLAGSPLLLPKLYSTEYWAWAEVAARTTISRAKSRYVCIFRMVPILRFRVQNCQRLDPTRSGLGSQRRGERCGGVLVTQLAVFLQRLVDDPFQIRRNFRVQTHHGRRSAIEDAVQYQTRRVS